MPAFLIFILILIIKSVEQSFFVDISIALDIKKVSGYRDGRILRNFRDNPKGIHGKFFSISPHRVDMRKVSA